VTGLGRREAVFMGRIAEATDPAPLAPRRSVFALLSASIVHRAEPEEVARLVASAGDEGGLPEWARLAVLSGLERYLQREFRETMRAGAALTSAEVAPLGASSNPAVRAAALAVVSQLEQIEARVRARSIGRPLDAAEQRRYEAGRSAFQICAACHQESGTGRPNVAPSLVDSHWVAADPELAIRIVLNGKEGTLGFPGAMPPIGAALTDEQVAEVVTYIRNSWGLHAGAVSPETVGRVRAAVKGRLAAWSDKTLERVESELHELKP
jgi:mono/diheme cytochrome c family protein